MSKKIFILGFFVTCFWPLVSSYSSGNCPIIDVTNGYVKYMGRGRIVTFFCNKSFVLVGSSSAICTHGEWNNPPPFCGKTTCPSLGRILHGSITVTHRGAIAVPTCDPGFNLIGSPSLRCTESGWNDTLPVCQANSLLQFNTCHFEPKESTQCNWIFKPALFKWTIMSSDKHDSSDMGYYPGFDHTLGPHVGGHYLYLENTMPVSSVSLRLEQRPDNGAKYVSPLFPAVDSTEEHCLIFFIYSFGPNAGNVKVTINNDTVWENTDLLRRNMWIKVTITLVHQRSPFRITIIGKGHVGQFSNTAIDDLRIAHGADCLDNSDKVLPYSVEPGLDNDEEELTTQNGEDLDYHEIYKRETTTEVSRKASHPITTEIFWSTNSVHLITASVPPETAIQNNDKATNNTESNIKPNLPFLPAGTEKLPQNAETMNHLTPDSTAHNTFIPITRLFSPTNASNLSHSPSVNASTNGDIIGLAASETSNPVTENEEQETSVLNTTFNDFQSTELSISITDSSINLAIHNVTITQDQLNKAKNLTGWTDFEKSMVYVLLVITSIIVLIVGLVIMHYRNYHTLNINNKNAALINRENVAFLNGVELLNKY